MTKLFAFPTWALTMVMLNFVPASHPWHGRAFSLGDWATHRTALTRVLDVVFWVWIITICGVLVRFFWRY